MSRPRRLSRSLCTVGLLVREGLPVVGLGHSRDVVLPNETPGRSPRLYGEFVRALALRHCHQRSILGDVTDTELVAWIGLDTAEPDARPLHLAQFVARVVAESR